MAAVVAVVGLTNAFPGAHFEMSSTTVKFGCYERMRLSWALVPGFVLRKKNRGVRCRAQESEDGEASDEGKHLEKLLQNEDTKEFVENLTQKMMDDEESKELLKDLATAAERVERAKRELERTNRLEQEILFVENQMARIIAEQNLADSLVAKGESDVQEAEAELRAAEVALVTARAGVLTSSTGNESENENFNKNLERVESGKAAAVSVIAGTLGNLPFLGLTGDVFGLGSLLSLGGIMASCALYGVTYRYIIRRDMKNLQLKSGAAAAFALVRGIAQVDGVSRQVGFPGQGGEQVLMATLTAAESIFIFGFATLALDYCISSGLLSPYPSRDNHV